MKIIRSLLLLIIIALVVVFFMRDSILKSLATEYGSKSLKTKLEIANLTTDISNKILNVKLLEINNLKGFNAKNILKIESITLDLGDDIDLENISVDSFTIDNTTINLEQGDQGINVKLLADKLKTSTHSTSHNTNNNENENNIIDIDIKNIAIKNTKIIANTQFFKDELVMPDIILNNIKADSENLASVLVTILLDEAEKLLKRKGVDILSDKLEETLTRKIGDKLGLDGGNLNEIKENAVDKVDEVKEKLEQNVKEKLEDRFKNILKF